MTHPYRCSGPDRVEPDERPVPLARARNAVGGVLRGSAGHLAPPGSSVDVVHARFFGVTKSTAEAA